MRYDYEEGGWYTNRGHWLKRKVIGYVVAGVVLFVGISILREMSFMKIEEKIRSGEKLSLSEKFELITSPVRTIRLYWKLRRI